MKEGWVEKPLRDVLAVLRNGLNVKQDKSGTGDKISRIESIWNGSFDPIRVGYAKLDASDKDKFKLKRGDILFSHINSPPHVGKTAIFDSEDTIYHGVNLLLMRPTEDVASSYLNLYLKSLFAEGFWQSRCKKAINQASVNQQDIGRVTISFPPLAEQKRIVAILDEAFESVEAAQANVAASQSNAEALLGSCLNGALADLEKESRTATVRDLVRERVLEKPQDGNHGEIHPTKAEYVSHGVPFVMAADLHGGVVNTATCRFISNARARALRVGFAKDGDVLLSHKGTIGRVAILSTDLDMVVLTPQVTYYRILDKATLINRYLYYYFQCESFQRDLAQIAGAGSTRAYIGITRQLDLNVVVPPLDKQRLLVARLSAIETASSILVNNYLQKIAALDNLKRSMSSVAFSGRLGLPA